MSLLDLFFQTFFNLFSFLLSNPTVMYIINLPYIHYVYQKIFGSLAVLFFYYQFFIRSQYPSLNKTNYTLYTKKDIQPDWNSVVAKKQPQLLMFSKTTRTTDNLPSADVLVKSLFVNNRAEYTQQKGTNLFFVWVANYFVLTFVDTYQEDPTAILNAGFDIRLRVLYGRDTAAEHALRSHVGGCLKTSDGNTSPNISDLPTDILLQNPDLMPVNFPTDPEKQKTFFISGIDRGNAQPGYWVMQTIFIREHNRLAKGLQERYPTWDDEKLFQTTVLLLKNAFMYIIMNEYIPHVIGSMNNIYLNFFTVSLMKILTFIQHLRTYFGKIQFPTIEIATVPYEYNLIYRWHSMVPLKNYDTNNNVIFDFNTDAYKPTTFLKPGLENLIITSLHNTAHKFINNNTISFLSSVDQESIETSRKLGVCRYNECRKNLGLSTYKSFDDITADETTKATLKKLYQSIDDMDLYVGIYCDQSPPAVEFLGVSLFPATVSVQLGIIAIPLITKSIIHTENDLRKLVSDDILENSRKATLDALVKLNSNVSKDVHISFNT